MNTNGQTAEAVDKCSYSDVGVSTKKANKGLELLLESVKKTTSLSRSPVMLDFGYFANVIDIGNNSGIAISTDGVGTKILVAQMLNKYDTIGIDCVAMNVNDIICVGARPLSMVDYIAVECVDSKMFAELGIGLSKGAELSDISIPAGEIAQIKEMIKGEREGFGFDLVGTAIGSVPLDRIITGKDIAEGDALVGLRSTGVHSNGLTLARKVLFDQADFSVDTYRSELGKTIGEALLEPTHIYVPEIMEMIDSNLSLKALVHITSDGFLNLLRVENNCSFIIDKLPDQLPIFDLIQSSGRISDEDMFEVYNMGIGFCVVIPENEVDQVFQICEKHKVECFKIGKTVKAPGMKRKVSIKEKKLEGTKEEKFYKIN